MEHTPRQVATPSTRIHHDVPPYSQLLRAYTTERRALQRHLAWQFPRAPMADIHDAISEVIADLFCEAHIFHTMTELRAWLHTAAKHRLLDSMKQDRRRAGIKELCEEPCYEDRSLMHAAERGEAHSLLLASLSMHERAIVIMHDWFENSFEEIATRRTDGVKAQALRQRYHRALKKLRRQLDKGSARQKT